MKSYNQFVTEATTSRENIQEALPALALLPAAGKALSYGFAAYQGYEAAKKLRKGDYGGAALDAAMAIPSAGVAGKLGKAFKMGQRGTKALTYAGRTAKAGVIAKQTADAFNEPASAAETQPSTDNKPSTGTQPAAPKPSSVVLARKGGVMGKLDKATGKWTKGDWTEKESARYKRVATSLGKNPAPAAPKPAAPTPAAPTKTETPAPKMNGTVSTNPPKQNPSVGVGELSSSLEKLADKTVKPVVQDYGRKRGEEKAGALKNIPIIGNTIKNAAGDAGAREAGKTYDTTKEKLKKGNLPGAINTVSSALSK